MTNPKDHPSAEFVAAAEALRRALPTHSIPSLSDTLPNLESDTAFEYIDAHGLTLIDVYGREASASDQEAAQHWLDLLHDAFRPLRIMLLYAILPSGRRKPGDLPARLAAISGLALGAEMIALPDGTWRAVGRIRYRLNTTFGPAATVQLDGHTQAIPRTSSSRIDPAAVPHVEAHLQEANDYWTRFTTAITPWIVGSGLVELVVEATVPEHDPTGMVRVPIHGNA